MDAIRPLRLAQPGVSKPASLIELTSPRLRGEHRPPSAAVLNKNAEAKLRLWREARRVRGTLSALTLSNLLKQPFTLTLSREERGEGNSITIVVNPENAVCVNAWRNRLPALSNS